MSQASEATPPFLRLPPELLTQILSYLLRQDHDDVIKLSSVKITNQQRRWKREVARLTDPTWKPPKADHFPAVLEVCSDLYYCGAPVFWGGNAFRIANIELLRGFLSVCHKHSRKYMRCIVFGEDH